MWFPDADHIAGQHRVFAINACFTRPQQSLSPHTPYNAYSFLVLGVQ